MATGKEFCGHLVPAVQWSGQDELFLQPVYIVPLEIFTTGLLARPEYKTVMAIVEAVGGRVSIVAAKNVPKIAGGEPKGRKLPVNVALDRAVSSAESAGVSEGREGWRALAGSSHVMARESEARACWKVWIRSGGSLVDTVTGKSFPVGELLGLLLPQEE